MEWSTKKTPLSFLKDLSNFLLPPYAELKEVVLDVTKIERTEKQRQEWEAIANSQRLRDQPLFSLGGLSP